MTIPYVARFVGGPLDGIDDQAYGIERLLDWYAADERGEMPYPPDYPKMAGEPKRVQPSKARRD